jgi:hypothetical protein
MRLHAFRIILHVLDKTVALYDIYKYLIISEWFID